MTAPRAAGRQATRRGPAPTRRPSRLAWIGALVPPALLLVVLASTSDESAPDRVPAPAEVTLTSGAETLASVSPERAARIADGARIPMPLSRSVQADGITRTLAIDSGALRRRLADAAAAGSAVVEVPERAVASRITAPIVQQAYRNNCETAALSMLLATVGVEQDQLRLQDLIVKAEPLDPESDGGAMIWGDPDEGFVGRVDGGGPAGGFGVFDGPVAELAERWAKPLNLSGERPKAIYRRLLAGHAVMVWIGLSDGPYQTWRSPDGDDVTVNFGEHTVVLTGIEGDRLFVNDPIDGQRKVWSKADFEAMWELLDRRAVSV